MRTLAKMALAVGALALLVGPAPAQPPRGGGGGRMIPQGPQGLLFLLQNKSVQKELKLEEKDLEKVPEAIMEALKKALTTEQLTRLKEIQLQLRGPMAFNDAKVQKELKFTDEQTKQVKDIMKDFQEEMRELRGAGFDREAMQKMQELGKETNSKLTKVLNESQKKQWKKMTGDPFEYKPDFPGGGRGGRGRRPNRDRE